MAGSFIVNIYATSIFAAQLINQRKFHWKRFKKTKYKRDITKGHNENEKLITKLKTLLQKMKIRCL